MSDNSSVIEIDGKRVKTLRDILPVTPGLRVLFIGKSPDPVSVDAGHYFQGRQGKTFWSKLINYGILRPTTYYEDDSLLKNRFGMTDIVKAPQPFGKEPSIDEYSGGVDRIIQLIKFHEPEVLVFVYKRVLDRIIELRFGLQRKSSYGFNTELDAYFGSRVFVFPMPGTPCKSKQAKTAMKELKESLSWAGY